MSKKDYLFINKLRLKTINKILRKVNRYSSFMARLTDDSLKKQTVILKNRYNKGETLDDLLPEAFATIREASKRILGMYPYDVQVLGAIVLHKGNIAEMKTGEGKTLTAIMPLYLNAISGKSTILVTTNPYLALRDYEEMKKVFNFLNLTVSENINYGKENQSNVDTKTKKEVYSADIVYSTNSILAFDYLLDNLVASKEEKYMSEFDYVIIDEVDEVLLDSAQMPLVISGFPRLQSNFYNVANTFVQTLENNVHYKYDKEKSEVWFTECGLNEAEKFFGITDLYSNRNTEIVRHINLALRAHCLFDINKDYVVNNEEIKLLNRSSGRILENTRLQAGQHQAIEAKENLKLSQNMRAIAGITYQNFFKLFKRISGMTGTGKVSENEFIKTYNLAVVEIPINKKMIRVDLPDSIYVTLSEKIAASVELLKEFHKIGRPVLLITGNVDASNIYSEILLSEGIAHSVLNAYNIAKEALIIKEAGRKNAVTIATSLAGRGTDIVLEEGVAELGGLAVICTERMLTRRSDLQAIGRAGRQGDPGTSKFFISLEDELLAKFGGDKIKKYLKKYKTETWINKPREITSFRINNLLTQAQKLSESTAENNRRVAVDFDESLRLQRKLIYNERNDIINDQYIEESYIIELLKEGISLEIDNFENITEQKITRYILDNITYDYRDYDYFSNDISILKEKLLTIVLNELAYKKSLLKNTLSIQEFFRYALLKAIDSSWIEQVDNLEQLKASVLNRKVAQRNPIYEFYKEADKSFDLMKEDIKKQLVKNISLSRVELTKEGKSNIRFQ